MPTFRFNRGQWYTVEFHYVYSSSPGKYDGSVEAWIDGVKVYAATNDLQTCGNGGSKSECSGLAAIAVSNYKNDSDTTPLAGKVLIDNLIVSRSYIGPPQTGQSSPPPSPPSGVGLQ